jgi:hypothetical protein
MRSKCFTLRVAKDPVHPFLHQLGQNVRVEQVAGHHSASSARRPPSPSPQNPWLVPSPRRYDLLHDLENRVVLVEPSDTRERGFLLFRVDGDELRDGLSRRVMTTVSPP